MNIRTGGDREFKGLKLLGTRPSFAANRHREPVTLQARLLRIGEGSDQGNHVLREVDGKGNVTTLAGVPRKPGFMDGKASDALFRAPCGASYGPDGAVYVAEKCTIRRIFRGEVTTVAGHPERSKTEDGQGTAASFISICAMAQDPRTGDLYVLDLDSVRRITPEMEVMTLAGSAHAEGFEEWRANPPREKRPNRMAGIPCFNGPRGIAITRGLAFIADSSNDAVRLLDLTTGELTTLLGGPEGGKVIPDRLVGSDDVTFRPGGLVDSKDVIPEQKAVLGYGLQHIALNSDGRCLLTINDPWGKGSCLAELFVDLRGRP